MKNTNSNADSERRSSQSTVLEFRSIDYVPRNERHGRPWYQGAFWFTTNFNLVTVVTGFLGPAMGLSVGWSIVAVVVGALFGTCFMAFHANQGPHLGLPQLIQSRAQFGLKGAVLPFIAAIFVYVGFNVFNTIVAADAAKAVVSGPNLFWFPVIISVAALIAIVGHDLMHAIQRWLMPFVIIIFAIFSFATFSSMSFTGSENSGFNLAAFLSAFSAAAGYQLSYAIYVSDYSRYLPADSSSPQVIGWTYVGQSLASVWMMTLGAILASSSMSNNPDIIASLLSVGNQFMPGFGTFVVAISVIPLVMMITVNTYGAMLTGASAVDAFRKVDPTMKVRLIGIIGATVAALVIALGIPASYLDSFGLFMTLILYFLIPWTAVNLLDFYFVRHGRYAITEIYKADSVYSQWSWRGISAYLAGFISMIPFFSTPIYTGVIAKLINGVDISFIVGLVVSAAVYYGVTRNMNMDNELRAIANDKIVGT